MAEEKVKAFFEDKTEISSTFSAVDVISEKEFSVVKISILTV